MIDVGSKNKKIRMRLVKMKIKAHYAVMFSRKHSVAKERTVDEYSDENYFESLKGMMVSIDKYKIIHNKNMLAEKS